MKAGKGEGIQEFAASKTLQRLEFGRYLRPIHCSQRISADWQHLKCCPKAFLIPWLFGDPIFEHTLVMILYVALAALALQSSLR